MRTSWHVFGLHEFIDNTEQFDTTHIDFHIARKQRLKNLVCRNKNKTNTQKVISFKKQQQQNLTWLVFRHLFRHLQNRFLSNLV